MILYKTTSGLVLEENGRCFSVPGDIDKIVCHPDLHNYLESITAEGAADRQPDKDELLAPIGRQQVWAAGVTYVRSRTARMLESEETGGSTFYDRVYSAERPELFFKALPHKVIGPGGTVAIQAQRRVLKNRASL
jgi:2-dehydro-3-deoxy-D-arabinonate dehydratase